MDVEDMFGNAPEEEVVEEEVPEQVATPTIDESLMMSNQSQPSNPSPMSTTIQASSSTNSFHYQTEEDTSAYKAWKATHEQELEQRAKKEQQAREEARNAGRAELDKILADHREKVEKTKATNRQHQGEHDEEDVEVEKGSAASWDRVSSYMGAKVEREGARDTSRYREIVLKMKHA